MLTRAVVILSILLTAFSSFAADDNKYAIPHFEIREYIVEGSTLISKDKLKAILQPFTGKDKDFGTVQQAIEAVEQAYHDLGFTTVTAVLPEQELENGTVRIRVIEGRIGRIKIEGNKYFDEANIRNSLQPLLEGEPPNIAAVSKRLALANENPAKKVAMQLKNTDKEDELDAIIPVKDERPWKVGISSDNTGTRQTGETRSGVIFQHANLFNMDHVMTLQYTTSLEKVSDVKIYGLGYHVPIYSLASSVDLLAAYSDVNSGTISVGSLPLQVSGKGTVLGLHYNQNLARIGSYEHKLTLGLDYRAYESNVSSEGFPLGNKVTVHPLSLTYSGTFTMEKGTLGFYLTGMRNLPGQWDANDDKASFGAARNEAPREYMMGRFGANLSYMPYGDWQARLVGNAQYTEDPLVPGEQFGIGGATSVRGFPDRDISNDKGFSGSLEIYSPDLCKIAGSESFQCRSLAFYDMGYASRNNPLPGEVHSNTIASVGPGIRITDGKHLTLSTDYGFVVKGGGDRTNGGGRWHFAATLMY